MSYNFNTKANIFLYYKGRVDKINLNLPPTPMLCHIILCVPLSSNVFHEQRRLRNHSPQLTTIMIFSDNIVKQVFDYYHQLTQMYLIFFHVKVKTLCVFFV